MVSDSTDGLKILEHIVAEEGSCSWAPLSTCKKCPLGSLIRSDDGKFMSCVEALNIDGLSEKEADTKYKEAAIQKIADIILDNAIGAN